MRAAGVTLVELLVVLAIVVIVLLLSAPVASLYQRHAAATAHNALLGAVQFARSHAVIDSRDITLCAGDTGGCAEFGLWEAGAVVLADGEPLRVWAWPRQVQMLASAHGIDFTPDGRVDAQIADAAVRFVICAGDYQRGIWVLTSGAVLTWSPQTCAL